MSDFSTVELNAGLGGAKSLHESNIPAVDGQTPPAGAVAQAVKLMGKAVNFWPGYTGPAQAGLRSVQVDDGGATTTRGAVLTDEGTFRCNFANASLAVSIGAVTVAGNIVTGTGFLTADVHYKDYFKIAADGVTAWVQIAGINSDTEIELVDTYVGSASGTGERAIMKPVVGSGGAVAVASGQCTLTSGTTNNAATGLVRLLDYAPLVFRARVNISQRIANQATLAGLREEAATPRYFARFRADGTSNTTIITETGRNPTGAPSAAETEQYTWTLPDGANSAQTPELRVEVLTEAVRFYVNGVFLAEHTRVMPHQHDVMAAIVEVVNATGAASTTTVTADFVTGKNHNKLEVGILSDIERIIAAVAPLQTRSYNVAGVIAVNTDLLLIDCRQARTVNLQAASIGTTGRLDFFLTNDLTVVGTAQPAYPIGGGAGVTTSTATGHWNIPTNGAAFLRVRLGVATTAGTTTLYAATSQTPHPLPAPTTQPVSGTVTATGVAGPAAHDAAVSGNPVRLAGRALTANYAAVASGDVADLVTTLVGALIQKPFAIPESDWTYPAAAGGITNTTDVAVKAAAAAGIRNYVTAVQVRNNSAVATEFVIKDGASTVLWRCQLPANMTGDLVVQFPNPLRGTAAAAVNVACLTTGAAVYANLQGYIAP